MAALWEFFSGAAEIDDSEIPAAQDQRQASPEAATTWQAVVGFMAGGEVQDSDLPASEHRASPERATPPRNKRSREQTTPAPAEDTEFEATLKSDAAAKKLTRDDLKEYLTDKGEQVPPNAKKDQLLALARTASAQRATPKPVAAEAASPKQPDSPPKLTWPITRLKEYAEVDCY